MAGGARAAAQAPHPTNLPLSRLCTSRRVTKGDQEAAILNSVQGEEENFIENQKRDGNTDKSNFARGRRENEKDQLRNAASCNQGARQTPVPFRPLGVASGDYDSQHAKRRCRGRGGSGSSEFEGRRGNSAPRAGCRRSQNVFKELERKYGV